MSVVGKTEEGFLADRIAEINESREGNLQGQVSINKDNFCDVLVVLSEPPPKVIKKLEAKGVDTRGVFTFEIEGRYYLPNVDT